MRRGGAATLAVGVVILVGLAVVAVPLVVRVLEGMTGGGQGPDARVVVTIDAGADQTEVGMTVESTSGDPLPPLDLELLTWLPGIPGSRDSRYPYTEAADGHGAALPVTPSGSSTWIRDIPTDSESTATVTYRVARTSEGLLAPVGLVRGVTVVEYQVAREPPGWQCAWPYRGRHFNACNRIGNQIPAEGNSTWLTWVAPGAAYPIIE